MTREIPEHVIKQCGSARAFRSRKRKALRDMERALSELRLGSAYFPNGSRGVSNIEYELKILKGELSVKNWGR